VLCVKKTTSEKPRFELLQHALDALGSVTTPRKRPALSGADRGDEDLVKAVEHELKLLCLEFAGSLLNDSLASGNSHSDDVEVSQEFRGQMSSILTADSLSFQDQSMEQSLEHVTKKYAALQQQFQEVHANYLQEVTELREKARSGEDIDAADWDQDLPWPETSKEKQPSNKKLLSELKTLLPSPRELGAAAGLGLSAEQQGGSRASIVGRQSKGRPSLATPNDSERQRFLGLLNASPEANAAVKEVKQVQPTERRVPQAPRTPSVHAALTKRLKERRLMQRQVSEETQAQPSLSPGRIPLPMKASSAQGALEEIMMAVRRGSDEGLVAADEDDYSFLKSKGIPISSGDGLQRHRGSKMTTSSISSTSRRPSSPATELPGIDAPSSLASASPLSVGLTIASPSVTVSRDNRVGRSGKKYHLGGHGSDSDSWFPSESLPLPFTRR